MLLSDYMHSSLLWSVLYTYNLSFQQINNIVFGKYIPVYFPYCATIILHAFGYLLLAMFQITAAYSAGPTSYILSSVNLYKNIVKFKYVEVIQGAKKGMDQN